MPMMSLGDTLAPPCRVCEATVGRFEKGIVEQTQFTATVVTGPQFELGQICVAPRNAVHVCGQVGKCPPVSSVRSTQDYPLMKAYCPDGHHAVEQREDWSIPIGGAPYEDQTRHIASTEGMRRQIPVAAFEYTFADLRMLDFQLRAGLGAKDSDMAKFLGDELKRLRRARGLSTRIAAEQAGMPHMTFMGYEFGKAVPPAHKRPSIAAVLGVPEQVLEDLVDEDESEVFLRARKLSESGKDAIRSFLREVREDERRQQSRG